MYTGFAGLRVIELGSMIAAPFAAHLLQQLGAEVIKIEPPAGDTTRGLVRGGPGGSYIAYNQGKKSLCLDLGRSEGQAIFEKLLRTADVVVHNLSPKAARRLRATYEDCAQINPKLIYCHIKGYGPGPMEDELASNPIVEAATGSMYLHRIDGRPTRFGPSYHDQFAGSYAAIGILAALMDNSDAPGSRRVEFGLYETGLHIAARDLLGVQLKAQLTGRADVEPSAEFSMPGYGAYETSDGRWIYLVMLTDAHWKRFWEAMGAWDEIDSALATLRQRKKRRTEVEERIKSAIGALAFDQASDRLAQAGVGFTEVLSPSDVLDAPQARRPAKSANFAFQGFMFESPNFPLKAQGAPERADAPPPLLGEHTRDILNSLGYDETQCDELVGKSVVVVPCDDKPLWASGR